MLRDEDGMIMPGCLFAIIRRRSRCQPFLHEVCSVLENLTDPFLAQIVKFLLLQMDPAAERGVPQTVYNFLHISHR